MVVDPRAPRTAPTRRGLREKMEAYLGEAMEKGLVLDAVLAQNEAQARSLRGPCAKTIPSAQKREGPSIKHDISVVGQQDPGLHD